MALLCIIAAAIIVSHKLLDIGMVDVLPQAYKANEVICAVRRGIVYVIAAGFIVALLVLSPDVNIPILTKAGKNSFWLSL